MYKTLGMEPMIKMIAHTFLAYALCGTHEPCRAKRRENLIQRLNDILTLTIHVDHADTMMVQGHCTTFYLKELCGLSKSWF